MSSKTPLQFPDVEVAVLMGGYSSEREVSLKSGRKVMEALGSLGCRALAVDVKDLHFKVPPTSDLVFIALHGTGGEDGTIQRLLEEKGITFTGSDAKSSQLAFDKIAAKKAFKSSGLPVARDVVLQRGKPPSADLPIPCVVKPSREGSSIGVKIVNESRELPSALEEAFKLGSEVLVEQFIKGRELTVGILADRPLPVIEIRPLKGWFDYQNKYTPGATDEIVPAPISDELRERVQQAALAAHRCLGCRDLSRSDFMVDEDGHLYLLEVNTIPGMTETSLLPKAAAAAGISFPELCRALVLQALARKKNELVQN
jgi:D-alanine-D-alanine ligase